MRTKKTLKHLIIERKDRNNCITIPRRIALYSISKDKDKYVLTIGTNHDTMHIWGHYDTYEQAKNSLNRLL